MLRPSLETSCIVKKEQTAASLRNILTSQASFFVSYALRVKILQVTSQNSRVHLRQNLYDFLYLHNTRSKGTRYKRMRLGGPTFFSALFANFDVTKSKFCKINVFITSKWTISDLVTRA